MNGNLQNLFEFVLMETPKPFSLGELMDSRIFHQLFEPGQFTIDKVSALYEQHLTHQTIKGQFINISLQSKLDDSAVADHHHECIVRRRCLAPQ